MMKSEQIWSIDCKDSKLLTSKLNSYITKQQELLQEFPEVSSLEICKITTYVDQKSNFKSLDLTWRSGKNTIRTVTILTNEKLKEIL